MTTATISCVVYDLATDEETPLIDVPLDTFLMSISWSPRDRRLAVVCWKSTDGSRSGQVKESSPEVQDALGNLPPEDKPYFTSNKLDLFHFRSNRVKHREMHPEADDGTFFCWVDWDPSGTMFVAKMWTAGTPEGRTHSVYTNPNGSKYRFYLFNGRLMHTLDQPEVEALHGSPHMISPFEVLIHAPHKLNFDVFRYNLFTHELVRLATPQGSVYQMEISPCGKELVYNFSSYQQPYELYRLGLKQDDPIQVTHYNDSVRDLNQVRADQMQFTLADGSERIGYMIQPADAVFPPENIPIVVWQQGGPTSPQCGLRPLGSACFLSDGLSSTPTPWQAVQSLERWHIWQTDWPVRATR